MSVISVPKSRGINPRSNSSSRVISIPAALSSAIESGRSRKIVVRPANDCATDLRRAA